MPPDELIPYFYLTGSLRQVVRNEWVRSQIYKYVVDCIATYWPTIPIVAFVYRDIRETM